jgi:hypothetical protein
MPGAAALLKGRGAATRVTAVRCRLRLRTFAYSVAVVQGALFFREALQPEQRSER